MRFLRAGEAATLLASDMQIPHTEILVTRDDLEIARRLLTPGEYVIGRQADCAIRIDDGKLSRHHARLTINFDHVLIEDLGSSNGTYVNDAPVTAATRLWPNQKIRVGPAIITLRRVKSDASAGLSLAPVQAAVHRILPEEFLRERKYDISGVVAHGGMGAILNAREATIDRKVAMKVMLDGSDPDKLARFVSEAKITAQLEHPNIVPVHEVGVDENEQIFYTMKFVRGITLKKVVELLAQGLPGTLKKYPLGNLLTVYQKLCDAVAFAHSKRVIHRDLKPANVMIGDFGEVLLMDWGLAKVLGQPDTQAQTMTMRSMVRTALDPAAASSTMAGAIMGTPQYMAPEQARGEIEAMNARSDIYSLGGILYNLLALRPPVDGETATIVERVARGESDPLTAPTRPARASGSHLPDGQIPGSLVAVVRKAMALDPANRYASVPELQHEIEAYQNGFATTAERASFGKQIRLFAKRNKSVAIAAAVGFLLLIGFTVNAVLSERSLEASLVRLRENLPVFREEAASLIDRAPTEHGALEKALEQIERAIDIAPEDVESFVMRGKILQTLQRLPEARTAFVRALSLNPANAPAKTNLELCDSILSDQNGGADLTAASLRRLYTALKAQGRSSEAVVIGRSILPGAAAATGKWAGVFKKAGIDRPLSVNDEGLLVLNLSDLPIGSVVALKGAPLGELDLTRTRVSDLSPLKGMSLRRLILSSTGVSDLAPIHGMPLVELSLNGTQVADLGPLQGLPIQRLNLADLKEIRDFSVLQELPLRWLSLDRCAVSDFAVLHGKRLESLSLCGIHLKDLATLAGVAADELRLEGCAELETLHGIAGTGVKRLALGGDLRISDLSPLHGLPLESLSLNGTKLSDLSPLGGSPLRELLAGSSEIRDLAPVGKMERLESLDLTHTKVVDLRPLHHLKFLRRLLLAGAPAADLSPLRGTPIEELSLEGCRDVRDVAPLAGMKRLIAVALPFQTKGATALRSVSTLRFIGFLRPLPSGDALSTQIKFNQAAGILAAIEEFEKARERDPNRSFHPGSTRGWEKLFPNHAHFGGSAYALIELRLAWTDAKMAAEQLGGHLATVTSAEEDAFLVKSFTAKLTVNSGYWLGAFADKPKGAWSWVTGEPWTFTHWAPGEPSGKTTTSAPEIRLGYWKRDAKSEAEWNDYPDSAGQVNGLIVEWED